MRKATRRDSVGKKKMTNEEQLLANFSSYYAQSLTILKKFGGPSVYFHTECIREQKTALLSDRHLELIYATLTAWGMHRMGDPNKVKTKLHNFGEFKGSILQSRDLILRNVDKRFDLLSSAEFRSCLTDMKDAYIRLRVSTADATLVANAKTLAHILPHLVPPIDRQHTIRFFHHGRSEFFLPSGKYRVVTLPNGKQKQFDLFVETAVRLKALYDKCDAGLFLLNSETFNTSYPKIVDNLVMAYVKSVRKPEKQATTERERGNATRFRVQAGSRLES